MFHKISQAQNLKMCGIFGHISKNYLEINENILSHRGPDSFGFEKVEIDNKKISFFHSRLEIIGLGEQGSQPFQMKGFDSLLIFNGEIYNYKELKKDLRNNFNEIFQTNTDTEVLYKLLYHYEIEQCLKKLNGMYSFAYLNKTTGEMTLARDPLGIKPLYYFHDQNSFSFSSEIKIFFKYDLKQSILNKKVLGEYFANGWVYEPDTLFKDIYKLESGHFLKFDILGDRKVIKKYWDIRDKVDSEINIKDIIKSQTITDVPYGIYFSGGYDSSIISYVLKDQNLINLNLALEGSESKRLNILEKQYDLKIMKLSPSKNFKEIYDELIFYMDEPISDPAIVPAYELALKSKELGIPVMLSGMGGDEIDAGYSRHKIILNLYKYQIIRLLPDFLLELMPNRYKKNISRLKAFMRDPVPANYFSLSSYLNKMEIDSLLNYNWFGSYQKKIETITKSFPRDKKFFILDFVGFLSSHNLLYMDKASMASSIEVRVPLLDKNLVAEYFKKINIINKRKSKKRLKSILKNYLGKNYTETKKEGFSHPIGDFITNQVDWAGILDYFSRGNLLDVKTLKKWVEISKENQNLVDMKLLHVYTFYKWMKTFKVNVNQNLV